MALGVGLDLTTNRLSKTVEFLGLVGKEAWGAGRTGQHVVGPDEGLHAGARCEFPGRQCPQARLTRRRSTRN